MGADAPSRFECLSNVAAPPRRCIVSAGAKPWCAFWRWITHGALKWKPVGKPDAAHVRFNKRGGKTGRLGDTPLGSTYRSLVRW